MKYLSGAVLLWLGIVAGAGPDPGGQNAFYSPSEWESITVTRYASLVVPGSRYTAVATTGGLLLHDRLLDRWRAPLTSADGLPEGAIEGVSMASDGTIAVRAGSGEIRVEPATGYLRSDRFPELPPVPTAPLPANLFTDPDYQYLSDGRIIGPLSISAPVTDVRVGEGAELWLTTWGLGAGEADLRIGQLRMRPHGLWIGDVRAMVVTVDRLIAGGSGDLRATGGLTEWQFAQDAWSYELAGEAIGLLSDRVFDMTRSGREIWLAVDIGVARRDATGRWKTWTERNGLPDHRVTAIASGSGAIWVGTRRGTVAIAGDSLSVTALPVEALITDIAAGDGVTWFATDIGALGYRGDWPTGTLFTLSHPEDTLGGRIDAVGTWKDEVWWAGSRGITAYDAASGEWLPVPGPGPLLPGEATSLVLDGTNVWVTTTRGVWRLIRDSEQWYHYDEADGLIDARVWCSALLGDTIWFGTRRGITRFDFSRRRQLP